MAAAQGGLMPVCEVCSKRMETEVHHWPRCYKCGNAIVNSYIFEEGACWNGDICQPCDSELHEQLGPRPTLSEKKQV